MPSNLRLSSSVLLSKAFLRRYALMIGMAVIPFSSLRVQLIRLCGIKIGKGCYLGFHVRFDTNYPEKISIGDHVTISHNVSIYTHTATPANSLLGCAYRKIRPVLVQDGAWLGANSLLLPGAVVAKDCFIGAGAVLAGQTEPRAIYWGNPARKIRDLMPDKKTS